MRQRAELRELCADGDDELLNEVTLQLKSTSKELTAMRRKEAEERQEFYPEELHEAWRLSFLLNK